MSREQLTAYQRWELESFDTQTLPQVAAILPTADQLERLQRQAHDEGYAEGMRQGSEKVAEQAEHLRQIVTALTDELQRFDQGVADELLELATTISRHVLRQAISLKPETILGIVNEVLGQMPLAQQRARLILHPEDAALVRESLGERLRQSGWEIIEDPRTSRGGCRLEATECEIDATLESRWQRVVGAIGNQHAWVE